MKRTAFLLILMFCAGGQAARAALRYVAANGSDGLAGTLQAPWATLSAAVSRALPGDTIWVRGGPMREGEIWIRADYGMGGRDGKYVTISAFPGEVPVFNNSARGMIIDASWVRVQGLHFQNGKPMYNTNWSGRSSHVEILGNTLSGAAGYAAILLTGDDNLVEKNTIQLEGNTVGTQGHGIYVQEGSGNIIRGNTISGMSGYGIHLYEEHRSEDPPGYRRLIRNAIVEGNVIFGSRERSGIIVAAGADSGPADIQGVLIRGNLIFNNAGAGITVQGWSPVSGVRICNNTLSGNEGGDIGVGGAVDSVQICNNVLSHSGRKVHIAVSAGVRHLLVRRNLYYPLPKALENAADAEAVEADPRFTDAGRFDFSLQPGSPAIDAGIDLGWPFLGAAPDLGALEVKGSAAILPAEPAAAPAPGLVFDNAMPNPFRHETWLRYRLENEAAVKLEIFDLTGRRVATLVDAGQPQGIHARSWDGRDEAGNLLPSGLYFCRLRTPTAQVVHKLIMTY